MKVWTLRTRLIVWSSVVTASALIAFAVAAAGGIYYRLSKALDKQLIADAAVFFAEFHEHGVPTRRDAKDALLLLKSGARLQSYAFGPTGHAPTEVYPTPQADWLAGQIRPAGFYTVERPGAHVRLAVFESDSSTLVLAASLHSTEETVYLCLRAFLLALPAVLLVVGFGSAWFAKRALRPLTELTAKAAGITADRLGERLEQPAVDDEVGRHIRVLNAMFDRLQGSFEQARRFTADASHELRTPLTILRGELEGTLRSGHLGEGQERTLLGLLDQVDHLQKIIGTLLLLARFDSGKNPLVPEPVDLSRLVADGAEDAELLATRSGIAVQADLAEGLSVSGDPVLLRRVVLNLVDNAVRHNRPGGRVRLALQRTATGGETVFSIANTGPGIPHDRQSDLFQRFFRLAADRNRESGGTGLGLSLCREIVVAHGGRIALTRGGPDETEFTVTLPPPPA